MDLTGVWTGETIGVKTRTHHWIIVQQDNMLDIYTRWQNARTFEDDAIFKAALRTEKVFEVLNVQADSYGEISDTDNFRMLRWVWGLHNGKLIPMFDVQFQRSQIPLEKFEVDFLLELYKNKSFLNRF